MTLSSQVESSLKKVFKSGNRYMLLLWRLGLGGWVNFSPTYGGQIMVLTHTGRKSGQQRRTPLNYAEIDGDIYCTAGFGAVSDWYKNIQAKPEVELWLTGGWWEGTAEEVSNLPNRLEIMRKVLIASGFMAPAIGLDPRSASDEALNIFTEKYRLVRIRRTAARTGSGGPGDLAWIWPWVALVLAALLVIRPRRRVAR